MCDKLEIFIIVILKYNFNDNVIKNIDFYHDLFLKIKIK